MSILQAGLKPVVHTHGSLVKGLGWPVVGRATAAMIKDVILNQLILPSVMDSYNKFNFFSLIILQLK